MKKTRLLGLGVCALALGAVAGVVSTQRALETKAGEGDITVYFRDATWWAADGGRTSTYLWKGENNNTWPGKVMSKVETKDGHNVWKATIDPTQYDSLIFARYAASDDAANKDWGAKTVTIDLASFDSTKPLYDISDKAESWGNPGVTGTWVAYEEPEAVEPTYADGYYILGIDGWGIEHVIASDAEKGENDFQKENIALEAADAFKIVKVESDTIVWASSFGYSALKYGTGKENFVTDDSGNLVVNEEKGGAYDIYLKGGEITINIHGELPPEPVYADGYYILGVDGWEIEHVVASDAEKGENDFQKENLSLDAGDAFKIVKIESDEIVWASSFGYSALKYGTGKENFVTDDDGNIVVDAEKGGAYDIYLKGGEITINKHGELPPEPEPEVEDGWYLAGVGGSWEVEDCLPNELAPLATDLAQFHEVELAADAEFKVVYIENDAIKEYYGYDFFKNGTGAAKMDGKIGKAEGESTNFKVTVAGTYSIYLFEEESAKKISIVDENYVAGPTGYYLLQDPWTVETAIKGEAENEGNYTYFLDLNLEAGTEFVIGYFEDGVRPAGHEYDYGWHEVSFDWSEKYECFEEGVDNHIKVKTAGVYSIYVSKNVDDAFKFICLNGSGLTPEVISAAKDLADYIDDKAGEAYAGLTPAERLEGCQAKYDGAKTQYTALGEAGQKYFRDNYATEFAIYEAWEKAVTDNHTAWNVRSLGGSNTALVVTLAVLGGGAIVAGAMIYFSRKRKASK